MEIAKTCKTCEFNFEGYCTSHSGIGYGVKIPDNHMEMDCWEIDRRVLYQLAKNQQMQNQMNLFLAKEK